MIRDEPLAAQAVTCAGVLPEANTVWKCSIRISVKMLMGVSALNETEPWRGRTTLTPKTHARLDGLILLTMLSWETCGGDQRAGRYVRTERIEMAAVRPRSRLC